MIKKLNWLNLLNRLNEYHHYSKKSNAKTNPTNLTNVTNTTKLQESETRIIHRRGAKDAKKRTSQKDKGTRLKETQKKGNVSNNKELLYIFRTFAYSASLR